MYDSTVLLAVSYADSATLCKHSFDETSLQRLRPTTAPIRIGKQVWYKLAARRGTMQRAAAQCCERARPPSARRRGLATTAAQAAPGSARATWRTCSARTWLRSVLTLTLAGVVAAADGIRPIEAVPATEPTADPTDLSCGLRRHVGSVLGHEAVLPCFPRKRS